MKKFSFRKIKFRKVNIHELDDRSILINLYATQILTMLVGIIIILFQKRNVFHLFTMGPLSQILLWGTIFAGAVILLDLLVSRFIPEELTDDGGINRLIFGRRALWHIVMIAMIVSVCEELLFRGAIQHAFGPYWTSILFAAVHIRYLRHWLMTGLVFAISYGLGWIYLQTGTLWTPIIAHFIIDLVMACIIRYRREA